MCGLRVPLHTLAFPWLQPLAPGRGACSRMQLLLLLLLQRGRTLRSYIRIIRAINNDDDDDDNNE